ncbi:hypothetical protein FOA52_006881 [Chlamydomonas sp. UWO 241]|nr:hypothetical protein FOA52_006881 [Chlamydomonas sp. UWO 241]
MKREIWVCVCVGDTSLRRSFVLSIPVTRGANWFLAGGGRRMDEEEATAVAAERIAAAAEDGTSLPVRLATDVVRFLYGGTGRREPADGGVVSASLLNAKPAVGGIGVEPRGGGVLRVLFTVASDAVADTVVRWRHELRRCVDSTAVFDVLSDREEAQHQALWPAFLAAKVAGKRAQFHRARLVVDGERMLPGLLAANAAEGVGPTGAALALLDFRKAYDTIDRGFLIAVMEAVGVGDGVLAWTRTILMHTYASAEVNRFISAPREYAAGVRQGCPAAPALFLFLGHALACFLRTCSAVGVEVVPGCRVTCPQYADDCMPLLRSCAPADVAALVETMAVFGRATGLVLNLGKCGILPLGSAGEGLLAGAEVAGLRVLGAGVSLGVPVSAGLPPPEGVTGVCRERLAAAYTKLARFPMSAFGRGHAAATYGVSRILFRAVHCGMTPEAERVLSRWTATLVDRSVGPDPPAELPRWASSVPGVAAAASRWGACWCVGPLVRVAVVAALVVDAMERGRRHLWRITCPRDGVQPPARSVAVERAGELATMDLWDALASFAEGGGMPRGWAGVVGPTHPFVGVVDGGLTLNKTS